MQNKCVQLLISFCEVKFCIFRLAICRAMEKNQLWLQLFVQYLNLTNDFYIFLQFS